MAKQILRRLPCLTMLASLPWILGGIAHGQEPTRKDDPAQHYPNAYFERFNPQTALDMLDRLPGFTIDAGEDIRGFGAGAGNVLINGARPVSKSGGVEESLQQILARSVVRIELIRGSAGANEASGQAVVANVITVTSDPSGRWTVELERSPDGDFNAMSEAVWSQPIGGWLTASKITAYREQRPLDGARVSRNAQNVITFTERESSPSDTRHAAISSRAERPAAGGSLTINGRVSQTPLTVNTERRGFDGALRTGAPDQHLAIKLDRTKTDAELGIDWSGTVSDAWAVKFLSLSSFERVASQSNVSRNRPVDTLASSSLFDSDQDTFESILRGTMTYTGQPGRTTEFGTEFTYNRLNSQLLLLVNDGDGPDVIDLPAANVVVDEVRGEAFANVRWQITKKLELETGLAIEHSRIAVQGDARNTRSFTFLKPSATLIYDAADGAQVRLSAVRQVGQLDFSDFAASASAADDRFLGGNPTLGPDQTTRLSASIDLRSEADGALNFEVFHEWRDDILEQVVLSSEVAGLGNAGSARVWGTDITADVLLDRFITGAILKINARFLDSRFVDPLISAERSVSSIDKADVFIEFRQDRVGAPFAWGLWYRAPLEGSFYFADEISLNRDSRSFGAFLETTRILGVKTSLSVAGIGNENFSRERLFFEPDRSGTVSGSESIRRGRGAFVTLTVTGQF